MRLLLDVHALFWRLSGDMQLGQAARAHVAEPADEDHAMLRHPVQVLRCDGD